MKMTLLYQVSCYTRVKIPRTIKSWDQQKCFKTQYNEILRTKKFCLLYQIFCYISSKKTIQNKENIFIGTGEISLLYQVVCFIRSLYTEFPLYKRVFAISKFFITKFHCSLDITNWKCCSYKFTSTLSVKRNLSLLQGEAH